LEFGIYKETMIQISSIKKIMIELLIKIKIKIYNKLYYYQ